MTNYNYLEAMKEDIKDYIRGNYAEWDIADKLADREEWENELNDALFVSDSVTGNASGSYTFNRWTAQEYVIDNINLLREAFDEFAFGSETIAEHFLNKEWETFDVGIRCYLLGQAIAETLDEIETEFEEVAQ